MLTSTEEAAKIDTETKGSMKEAKQADVVAEEKPVETVDEPSKPVDKKALMEEATLAFAQRSYEKAAEMFSQATELFVAEFGEDSIECAPCFYYYGLSLYYVSVQKTELLGENAPLPSSTVVDAVKGEAAAAASSKAGKIVFDQSNEVDDEEEDEEGEEDGEEVKDEEEDDMALAWQMLDMARVLYSKEPKENAIRLADIHITLGDISLESELWDEAIGDFVKALELKQGALPATNRQLAEIYYKLALSHEYKLLYEESMEYLYKSVSVLKAKLEELQTDKSSDKGKGSANDKDLEEIQQINDLLPEMEGRVMIELKKKNESIMDKLKDDSAVRPAQQAAPVNDISNLVRTKRKVETAPSQTETESKRTKAVEPTVAADAPSKEEKGEAVVSAE